MAAEATAVKPGEETTLLLTRRQAARLLNISEWSVSRAVACGLLEGRKLGKKLLIPRTSAEQFASRLPSAV